MRLSRVAVLGAVLLWAAGAAWGASPLVHTDVFVSGKDGYTAYRIPCIVTAADGSLLAFVEARKNNLRDPGREGQEIDLAMKRSTDGGRSWSAMTIVEDAPELWSSANPAAVTDRETGRIWLFYIRCKPGRGSHTARPGTDDVSNLIRWSGDHGRTWSAPIDVTAVARDFEDPQWRITVPGPGGAIQTRSGRLVVPCWRHEPSRNFVLYSDDHGAGWRRGALAPGDAATTENQLAELADGRLLMDRRQRQGPRRLLCESSDGGETWGPPRPGQEVTPVMCGLERWEADGAPPLLAWTGPAGPGRRDLTLWISRDEGRTFVNPRLMYSGPSAYSDLTVLPDGSLGVLWERGVSRNYEAVAFTRIERSWAVAEE